MAATVEMWVQLAQKHWHKLLLSSLIDEDSMETNATFAAINSKIVAAWQLGLTPQKSASKQENIPLKWLEGMWGKASQLITSDNAIIPAPGQDPEVRMVLSYSSKMLHMVTPKKGGYFSCDSNCLTWKSMGICSHSVAVAEINKKLPQFLPANKRRKANVLVYQTPIHVTQYGNASIEVWQCLLPLQAWVHIFTMAKFRRWWFSGTSWVSAITCS